MALTGIRKDVFMDRYARKDDDGKAIETSPEQMWDRVAAAIAEVEAPDARAEWAARFRQALDGFKFVPGGRILAGAGTGQKVTFYNCLPPDQPVLTPSGYVPIAEVDVRDFVVTGQGRARMVTQVFAREADEPLYRMRVAGGALLRLTGNHPVLARPAGGDAAWVRAAELGEGDLVGCLDAGARRAADAQAWHVRRDEPVGWSPRSGAQVLVRERRETYLGLAWRAIEAVERLPYCGTVYDLEVEEDHSFVTAGAIVSNCYVIPSPEDSRRGIMDSVGLMVEIMSRGGGVGVNLSSLRPRGSYVRGVNGTASGPVSWGEVYSTATGAVIQGGSRRGALMLMLDDDHPDIEEFITVKKDLNRINNANLSVCVSDRFMEAVKQDGDWDLKWDGKVYRTIHARDLWNLICESAWASGEPGVVFMERYQKWSNTWYCEEIRCVNPCFVGSTRIATSRGLMTAEELYRTQEPLMVLTDRRAMDEARQVVGAGRHTRLGVDFRPAVPVFKTRENTPVWKLVTEHGYEVTATADHRFLTPSGYVQLEHLREGDVLYLQSGEGGWSTGRALPLTNWGLTDRGLSRLKAKVARGEAEPPTEWSADLGRLLGWVVADGYTYTHHDKPSLGMVFGAQEQELMPYFRDMIRRWFGISGAVATRNHTTALMYDANIARFALGLGLSPEGGPAKTVPSSIWSAPRDAVVGFLQGLFTADGTVNVMSKTRYCSVRLASSSRALLSEVQQLLLNLGIVSTVYLRLAGGRKAMPDSNRDEREYAIAPQYELVITRTNKDRFMEVIGFLTEAKQAKLRDFLAEGTRGSYAEAFITRVHSIEPAGTADVFDTTEDTSHSVVISGFVSHNCGEQGLGPWGVCNLGAINIDAFVKHRKFDWASLRETVAIAMRFLDNVIDATEYYFVENERQQREGIRRTGLGSMGLADALIKMELRYGSPEAIAFCDKLYATVRDVAYRTSAEIAVDKGPFPAFDREKYLQGHFIKELPAEVRDLIAKNGIRNGVLLTQAPTGTTSLLAGVSSGIEPVYAFSFKRVDRTGTHVVYHDLYQQWMEQHPDEPAPAYFVSADQLTPEEHVRMQAVIQQYVDSSISKTVNAPNSHTVEEVKTLYTLAYDLGCKGVTYFRDGCRAGVLTRLEDDKPKAEATPAATPSEEVLPLGRKVNGGWGHIRPIERPARLIGFTDRKQTPLGTLFLTLNTLDGHPVELFATIGKAGSDVSAFTEAIARLVSVALRSGVDPNEVASQLKGIGGSRSVGFGAARVRSVPDAIGQFIDEVLDQDEAQGKGRPTEGNGHHNGHGKRGTHALKPVVEIPEAEILAAAGPAGAEAGHGHAAAEAAGEANPSTFNLCPACGLHTLAYIEGCALCFSCGYSEC